MCIGTSPCAVFKWAMSLRSGCGVADGADGADGAGEVGCEDSCDPGPARGGCKDPEGV